MTVIDSAGLLRLLVYEEIEGMAHELHFVQGLVDRHGFGFV